MNNRTPEIYPAIPGYTIVRKLGSGGMANVYLAVQESFGRSVALKVMYSHLLEDESFAKRFVREARLAAQLSHNCIVPIYEIAHLEEYYYMAMEYLPGGDLRAKIKAGLRLPEGLTIIITVARGLNYAASKGLVHRDIKPENILFREDGSPLIGDFGIARLVDSETKMTVTGSILGTPRYMSPEQAKSTEVDPRSDLYSLGIILYEVLTGAPPFLGESPFTVGLKHITEAPPDLPEHLAGFQPFMDTALAKEPEDRFTNGEVFAKELSILASQLTESQTESIVYGLSGQGSDQRGKKSAIGNILPEKSGPGTNSQPTTLKRYGKPARRSWIISIALVLITAGPTVIWMNRNYFQPATEQQTEAAQSFPEVKIRSGLFQEKSTELLARANQALAKKQLYAPPQDNAQYYLTTLLALVPDHTEAREKISQIFDTYLDRVEASVNSNELATATEFIGRASQIAFYIQNKERNNRFTTLYETMSRKQQQAVLEEQQRQRIETLLVAAHTALNENRLTSPVGNNAFEYFQQVLVDSPDNKDALQGIRSITDSLLQRAREKLTSNEFSMARAYVAATSQLLPDHPGIEQLLQDIQAAEDNYGQQLLAAKNKELEAAKAAERKRQEKNRAEKAQINDLLTKADEYLQAGALITPEDANALACFNRVVALEPTNIEALQGREMVGKALITRSLALARQGELSQAKTLLSQAESVIASKVQVVRAGRELARLAKEFEISKLLENGTQAFAAGRLSSPEQDSAQFYYEQVILLDPDNLLARQGIEAIGQKYLALARTAIGAQQLTKAASYIDLAKQYTSGMAEVESLQSLLAEAQRQLDVNQLLEKAVQAFREGHLVTPVNNNAHFFYSKALSLSPQDDKALKGLKQIQQHYKDSIAAAISSQQFDKAGELLKTYTPLAPDSSVNSLKSKLTLAKSGWEKQQALLLAKKQQEELENQQRKARELQKLQETEQQKAAAEQERKRQQEQTRQAEAQQQLALLHQQQERQRKLQNLQNKAAKLSAEALTDKKISQLQAVYGDIFALDPDNQEAKKGIRKIANYESQLISREISKGNLQKAEALLQQTTKNFPDYDLSEVRTALDNAQSQHQQLLEYLSEAESLIQQPYKKPGLFGNNDKARRILVMAYENISKARKIAPGSQKIKSTLAALDKRYASTVDLLINDDEVDEAAKFISDTSGYQWDASALKQSMQKLEAAKKNNNRVPKNIGGGF
jgi:serine/threonine-protein kinase PpkA